MKHLIWISFLFASQAPESFSAANCDSLLVSLQERAQQIKQDTGIIEYSNGEIRRAPSSLATIEANILRDKESVKSRYQSEANAISASMKGQPDLKRTLDELKRKQDQALLSLDLSLKASSGASKVNIENWKKQIAESKIRLSGNQRVFTAGQLEWDKFCKKARGPLSSFILDMPR